MSWYASTFAGDKSLGVMTDTSANPPAEDTRYLKRRDTATEHGWQFQFELDPLKESKWFSDKKYGTREESLAAAQRYRSDFFQTARELGMITDDRNLAGGDTPIYISLNARNTSGIVGVCRVTSRRRDGRRPEEVWAANYRTEAGKHGQKKYSVNALGERAALRFRRDYVASVVETVWLEHKRQLVEKHLDDMTFLIEYIESVVDESELYTFLSTLNSPDVSPTEKQALIAIPATFRISTFTEQPSSGRDDANPSQAARQRQATKPGPVVRGTFSPARAWRPAVVDSLARTLHEYPSRSPMQA